MTWDIALTHTGDWAFSANRDLMHVEGIAQVQQRIITRLKIPRGSFVYDTDGSLGSDMELAMRYSMERAIREVPTIIEEALGGMDDTIQDVRVEVTQDENNPRQLNADIVFGLHISEDEIASLPASTLPEFSVTIPIAIF